MFPVAHKEVRAKTCLHPRCIGVTLSGNEVMQCSLTAVRSVYVVRARRCNDGSIVQFIFAPRFRNDILVFKYTTTSAIVRSSWLLFFLTS